MPISATQACAEATASASEDEVMLITIEPICPAFVESGAPSPRECQRFDKALPIQNMLVFQVLAFRLVLHSRATGTSPDGPHEIPPAPRQPLRVSLPPAR